MKPQIRIASITIRSEGVTSFQLPIIHETTKRNGDTNGFVCRTGDKESYATEWFPVSSPRCDAHEVSPKR